MHHQHEGMHAQYARDIDGRKMIALQQRDASPDNLHNFIHKPIHNTNGEDIVMNIPEGFPSKDALKADTNDSGVATAVNVVYVTAAPSFSGSVLGYVTATVDPNAQNTAAINAASASVGTAQSISLASSADVTYTPMVGTPIATTRAAASTAPSSIDIANSIQSSPGASAQNSNSNSNASSSSSSNADAGLTDGAKAGLAIGIILGLALFAGLIFFCLRRSKKNSGHEELNEKSSFGNKRGSFFGTSAGKRASADSDRSFGTIHNTATAPRLSLRPVTQFFPVFGDKRKSGNLLATGGHQMSEKPNANWDRRPQAENPFADSAAQNEKQANPFDQSDARSINSNGSDGASSPQTPVAGGAAGPRGSNNVHRVQLDFKPSMDDELELKSGQLVRMIHEYDDGWALCVRMDRSQQGVAPRTCLSKQPVKPRGPPPAGRTSPQGNMRGPQSGPGVARKPVPGQAI